MSNRWKRNLGGVLSTLGGGALLGASLLYMNAKVEKADEVKARVLADVAVEKKKEAKKPQPVRQKPPPKPRASAARAPRPSLAANLDGLGVGVPLFAVGDLSSAGDELLGDAKAARDLVMSASAVDKVPTLVESPPLRYPPRAAAKGVEGYVLLRLLVGEDGEVLKASVLESSPAGIFEEAALEAAKKMRYEPGTYQGQPHKVDINQRVTFKLT